MSQWVWTGGALYGDPIPISYLLTSVVTADILGPGYSTVRT
jgi:hypothetical protein